MPQDAQDDTFCSTKKLDAKEIHNFSKKNLNQNQSQTQIEGLGLPLGSKVG